MPGAAGAGFARHASAARSAADWISASMACVAEAGRLRQAAMLVEPLGQLAQAVVDGIDALDLAARLLQMGVEAADLRLDLLEVVALEAPGDVLEGDHQALLQLLDADAERAGRLVGVDAGDGALQAVGDVDQAALQPGAADAVSGSAARRGPAAIVGRTAGRRGSRATPPRFPRRPGSAPRPTSRSQGLSARLRLGGSPPFRFGRRHAQSLWARGDERNALTSGGPQVIEGRSKRIGVGFGRAGEGVHNVAWDAAPARKLVAQSRNPP